MDCCYYSLYLLLFSSYCTFLSKFTLLLHENGRDRLETLTQCSECHSQFMVIHHFPQSELLFWKFHIIAHFSLRPPIRYTQQAIYSCVTASSGHHKTAQPKRVLPCGRQCAVSGAELPPLQSMQGFYSSETLESSLQCKLSHFADWTTVTFYSLDECRILRLVLYQKAVTTNKIISLSLSAAIIHRKWTVVKISNEVTN